MFNNLPCTKFSFKIYDKSCLQPFILQEITTEDVSNVIHSIKSHSAPGKDDILPKVVKLAKCISSPCLVNFLFEKILEKKMSKFIANNNILMPFQFGYREKQLY